MLENGSASPGLSIFQQLSGHSSSVLQTQVPKLNTKPTLSFPQHKIKHETEVQKLN